MMRWLLLAAAAFLIGTPVSAEEYSGIVVGIQDGDTCTVYDGNQNHRVRLGGIDAPEKTQAFGQASKHNLSQLIFQKEIRVNVETHDRYGREIGWLNCAGIDVNQRQVESGLAWMYRKYTNREDLNQSETRAREARFGLWQDSYAIPPWKFRHQPRAMQPVSN